MQYMVVKNGLGVWYEMITDYGMKWALYEIVVDIVRNGHGTKCL